MKLFYNQQIDPRQMELYKERRILEEARQVQLAYYGFNQNVELSLRQNGGCEYYIVSKKFIRQWQKYVHYHEDFQEGEFIEQQQPDRINEDLILNEKFLFKYHPEEHEYNQSIKKLRYLWDYELMLPDTHAYLMQKYKGIPIRRTGVQNGEGKKRVIYVNLQKQNVLLKLNGIEMGKIQVDGNATVQYWRELIRVSLEQIIKSKIDEVRLWVHRHKKMSQSNVKQWVEKWGDQIDGEILQDRTSLHQIDCEATVIIDLRVGEKWQFNHMERTQCAKNDFHILFERACFGCGRYACSFDLCHRNPGFFSVGLSKEEIKSVCITQLADDNDYVSNACWKIEKQADPLHLMEVQKMNKKNLEERMSKLCESLEAFGASFVIGRNEKNEDIYCVDEKDPQVDFDCLDLVWKTLDQKSFFQYFQKQQDHKQNIYLTQLLNEQTKINNYYEFRAIFILINMESISEEYLKSNNYLLIKVISQLSLEYKQLLAQWLGEFTLQEMQQVVQVVKNIINNDLLSKMKCVLPFQDIDQTYLLKSVLEFYKVIYQSNIIKQRLRKSDFYIPEIAKFYVQDAEKQEFIQFKYFQHNNWREYYFTFCIYPFAIPIDFKSKLLNIDSKISQQEKMRRAIFSYDFILGQTPFLHLTVERNNIIETTLKQLSQTSVSLKMPLKIQFAGEQGVDEGGPKREFFSLLMQNLFNLDFGMFLLKMSDTILWFNPKSFEMPIQYELIGKLLGLALYNAVLLDLRFPTVIFKKLMNEQVGEDDLKEVDIDLYTGFIKLREYTKNDMEDAFALTFQASYSVWGDHYYENLKPNGSNIFVTQQNKEEYIKLYVDWYLNRSIEKQFNLFQKGFIQVVEGDGIKLFSGEEVQKLIVGIPEMNMSDLEKVTQYDGYDRNSEYIKSFWNLIKKMDIEGQKRFLFFCTGSDRVPVGGMKSMKFIIQKHGEDTEQLPSAHTCFNVLLLPHYKSFEVMKKKLEISLNNAEGFGLM